MQTAGEAEEMEVEPQEVHTPPQAEHAPLVAVDDAPMPELDLAQEAQKQPVLAVQEELENPREVV